MEMDSSVVINWLTKPVKDTHPLFHMIQDCVRLSRKPWCCKFCLVRRDANNSADNLAKNGA